MPSPTSLVGARVAALRRAANLSLAELARRSGVARATLTQLEAGEGNPTLETLYALADALGAPLGDLIAEPAPPAVVVVRAGDAPALFGETIGGHLLERIELGRHVVDLFALQMPARRTRTAGAHPEGTREHLLVTRGRARVGPRDAPVELGPGDLAVFDAAVPHLYAALDDQPAEATLLIVSPRA
jgi:transcriptional regulator with XRE-family HTH domain